MAGHTITRAQLTEAVYQEVGLSRNESAELVESVIAEISDALERGEMVKISSFGSFAVRHKGQRVGRNPKTGQEVPISPRRVLVFRAWVVPESKHLPTAEQAFDVSKHPDAKDGFIAVLRTQEYSRIAM